MQRRKVIAFIAVASLLSFGLMSLVNAHFLHQFELRRHRSEIESATRTIEFDCQQLKKLEDLHSPEKSTATKLYYCQHAPIAFLLYDHAFEALVKLGETPVETKAVAEARELLCKLRQKFNMPKFQTDQRYRQSMIGFSNGKLFNGPPKFGAGNDLPSRDQKTTIESR